MPRSKRYIYIAAVQDNGSILISIRDYGYGIPQTEVQKIFERFYRVGDVLTSRIKGSGFGSHARQRDCRYACGQDSGG